MNVDVPLDMLKDDIPLFLDFMDFFLQYRPHDYQLKFLKECLTKTRIAGKWCRQSGKSYTVAAYTLFRAITGKTTIILVSPTQNQSDELLSKVKDFIYNNPDIQALVRKDTQKEIEFSNKSRIISLPSGADGRTIRGYTCDILIIEEAGVMDDDIVNQVLIPMLASKKSRGQIIKIGTPLLRNHFYRSCFEDSHYTSINVIWKDCVKVGQYSQEFIDEQKGELTDLQFRTEYEAEFIDASMMFFPSSILDKAKATYTLFPEI